MKSLCTALALLVSLSFSAMADDVNVSAIGGTFKRVFNEIQIRRPIVITHDNVHSDLIYIASQYGKVHVIKDDEEAEDSELFMDIEDRVVYNDKQNEEGLLGLAFHPKFKDNGEVFVYYTSKKAKQLSVVSRFRTGTNGKVDPSTEEEIIRIPQPYWNHNGGQIVFGPEGYLYIALGDGGKGGDPHKNGQNRMTLLGSVLRIDVNKKANNRNYSIPKGNPFTAKKEALNEIYAYGIRNIWGMSFDTKTGHLWAADVGQKLWEEVNIIVKGGNYGWNAREGWHKYENGSGPKPELIEPIWEYPHELKQGGSQGGQFGKSITGGFVYRGSALKHLDGYYVYGDYVSGGIWALKYDWKTKKTTENRLLKSSKLPVMAFGQDANGELYHTTPIGAIFKLKAN
jgi:hypothetical protein